MSQGSLTSAQLVRYYLRRIESQKHLNAVISLNPDVLNIASQLDVERMLNGKRGKLHGIPVLIKDNIDTHGDMPNTAGSLLLKTNYPDEDAQLVSQLRAAGAIILGKANLSEMGKFQGLPFPEWQECDGRPDTKPL